MGQLQDKGLLNNPLGAWALGEQVCKLQR